MTEDTAQELIRKINDVDKHMQDALAVIQTINDNVMPIMEKLMNHPMLRGFFK